MDTDMKDTILETMANAEMILVGIGEQFGGKTGMPEESKEYGDFRKAVNEEERFQWMVPFLEEMYIRNHRDGRVMEAYKALEQLLREKNYFIVSLRTDDFIYGTELKKDRIVAPCGGYRMLQCGKGCGQRIFEKEERLLEKIADVLQGTGSPEALEPPLCPVCGMPMVYNNKKAEYYVEEGYLEAWGRYKKWLQGTVNKRLCMLELGVGMEYPGVVRWPFEKMVIFNQKASLFRVHSKLYQFSDEIKERGYKVKENPVDFLINGFV